MKQFWSDLGGKLGVGMIGAGFLLVFLGWNGAASVDRLPSQFPYLISGGLAGLSFVVVGVGLLIVQNQRADRAALQATMQELIKVLRDDEEAVETEFQLPTPRPTPPQYAPGAAKVEVVHDHEAGHDGDHDDLDDTRVQPAVASSARPRGRRKPLRADDA